MIIDVDEAPRDCAGYPEREAPQLASFSQPNMALNVACF